MPYTIATTAGAGAASRPTVRTRPGHCATASACCRSCSSWRRHRPSARRARGGPRPMRSVPRAPHL